MTTSLPKTIPGATLPAKRTVVPNSSPFLWQNLQTLTEHRNLSKGILSESGKSDDTDHTLTLNNAHEFEIGPGNYKISSESALWDVFRRGNELAFVNIYRSYVNMLFNYGRKFSSDKELIKDCVQDFFVYLKEHSDRLGSTTSIKFYLLRSFRRRLFVYMKKVKKQAHDSFDSSESDLELELEIEDCNTQKFINEEAKTYMIRKLNKCLGKIGEREREAIYFYYYEGMSYKEIAELMQFSHVSSARRLIYIALRNLKDVLY